MHAQMQQVLKYATKTDASDESGESEIKFKSAISAVRYDCVCVRAIACAHVQMKLVQTRLILYTPSVVCGKQLLRGQIESG